jgi:uncharacterized membrane protein YheB (UPF0754 family)
MAHIQLSLKEIYKLDSELNGFANQETGEILLLGLLSENLSLPTKYWLTNLAKKTSSEKFIIDQLRKDLIVKYGTKDKNNNFEIAVWVDDTKTNFNPLYVQFQEEFNSLLQEVKEIEYHEFKLEEFNDVKTSDNYIIFYKLIQID